MGIVDHINCEGHLPVKCDNCEWVGLACDTEGIHDLPDRVAAGEIMPVGECPKCGALAHYAKGAAPNCTAQALLDAYEAQAKENV